MIRFALISLLAVGLCTPVLAQGGSAGGYGSYAGFGGFGSGGGSQAFGAYGNDSYGSSGSMATSSGRLGFFARRAERRATRSAPVASSIMRVAVPQQQVPVMQYSAPMQDCIDCQLLQQQQRVPVVQSSYNGPSVMDRLDRLQQQLEQMKVPVTASQKVDRSSLSYYLNTPAQVLAGNAWHANEERAKLKTSTCNCADCRCVNCDCGTAKSVVCENRQCKLVAAAVSLELPSALLLDEPEEKKSIRLASTGLIW